MMHRAGRLIQFDNNLIPSRWLINRHNGIATGIANGISVIRLSTSPDYLNYETWHRNNYEDALRTPSTHHYDKVITGSVNDNRRWRDTSVSTVNSSHADATAKSNSDNKALLELPRTSVLMELSDRVGALHDVLKY